MFEYELRCNLRLPQISFLKQSEAMSACVQSKNEKTERGRPRYDCIFGGILQPTLC